jgi:hypothetical protein
VRFLRFLRDRVEPQRSRHFRPMTCLAITLLFAVPAFADDGSSSNPTEILTEFNRRVVLPSIPSGPAKLRPAVDANEIRFLCQLAMDVTLNRSELPASDILRLTQHITAVSLNSDVEKLYGYVHELQAAREAAARSISVANQSFYERQQARDRERREGRLRQIREHNQEIDRQLQPIAKDQWDKSKTVMGGLLRVGVVGLIGGLAKTSESEAYKTDYRGLDADLSAEQIREVAVIEQRRNLVESPLRNNIIEVLGKISKAQGFGEFGVMTPPVTLGMTEDAVLDVFRNPLALARLATLKTFPSVETARTCARIFFRCASLCPSSTVYDAYRRTYLCGAAYCMTQAAVAANPSPTSYSHSRTESSTDAVTLWTIAAKSADGELDITSQCNCGRALALDCRYAAAATVMTSVAKSYKGDPAFALRYAKVLSLSGNVRASFAWLKYCLQLDSSCVGHVRSCPDYEPVRKAMSSEFDEATTVKYSWDTSLGYIWDSVTLTNDSPFRMTDVTFKVKIIGTGGTWTKQLSVDSIEPGATQTWNLGFQGISVRDGVTDESATVSCAQD